MDKQKIIQNIMDMWHVDGHLSEEQRDYFIDLFTAMKPKYCLEIGFAGGRHTVTMLNSCNPVKVISVDIDFDYNNGREYVEKIKNKFNKIEFIEQDTANIFAPSFFKDKFPNGLDYVLVDGGHTYNECLFDMHSCWDSINKGGIMVVDDYESGPPIGCNIPDVTEAVDQFGRSNKIEFLKLKLNDGKGMAVFIK